MLYSYKICKPSSRSIIQGGKKNIFSYSIALEWYKVKNLPGWDNLKIFLVNKVMRGRQKLSARYRATIVLLICVSKVGTQYKNVTYFSKSFLCYFHISTDSITSKTEFSLFLPIWPPTELHLKVIYRLKQNYPQNSKDRKCSTRINITRIKWPATAKFHIPCLKSLPVNWRTHSIVGH